MVEDALRTKKVGQLVLVKGDAGAGKTVLMSNIFYDLTTLPTKNSQPLTITMMVNHK